MTARQGIEKWETNCEFLSHAKSSGIVQVFPYVFCWGHQATKRNWRVGTETSQRLPIVGFRVQRSRQRRNWSSGEQRVRYTGSRDELMNGGSAPRGEPAADCPIVLPARFSCVNAPGAVTRSSA